MLGNSKTAAQVAVVERLSKKIVHFLIKASNLVQHLLNSFCLILDGVIKITNHDMLKEPEK